MRLVSAIWDDCHPFDNLPFITGTCSVVEPEKLLKGDILIVHGGEDINPALYGKGRSSMSGASHEISRRDRIEWDLMKRAKELGIPIIGICRGAQMLCALEGGYLIQHVNGHSGRHLIEMPNKKFLQVNSIHHQMMQPANSNHELLGWSKTKLSDVYYDVDELVDVEVEPEYIYFPDAQGFAVQWHPEMMRAEEPANIMLLSDIERRLYASV